jgi:hypothetical protein
MELMGYRSEADRMVRMGACDACAVAEPEGQRAVH